MRPRMRSRLGRALNRLRRTALGDSTHEATERRDEQLGKTDRDRPEGFLIWVLSDQASEVGPAPALAQALEERIEKSVHVLATPLEEKPLVEEVEAHVIHQFAPGDTDGTIRRFLDHWQPDAALVLGQPARARLLTEAARRGMPLFHASSHRAQTPTARKLPAYLAMCDRCFAPSASDANVLRSHLKNAQTKIEVTGPLSDTTYALPCNEAECDELAKLLGGRPIWLGARITRSEVSVVEDAHRKAFRSAHRLLLILVPRPGENAPKIAKDLEERGWRVALRSNLQEPDPEVQVYIADTEDELGMWYRLAPVSFIGGSLDTTVEPTDPFNAAALGSAVLHGPNEGRNPARFKALAAHGASSTVTGSRDLGDAVISLLAPDKAASLAQAGWNVTTESANVVERIAEVLEEQILEAGLAE
ncbi:MAG: glycosyltransferase N-terminal domain-containing protein [Pseudomonadota bacterium]